MSKQNNDKKQTEIKCFPYKFTPLMLGLIVAVLLLCGAGIGVSIWRIVKFGIKDFNDVIKYPFLIAVCVFCIAFVISVFVRSQYVIKDNKLITQFGFIKSSYEIDKMTAIIFDRQTNKLTIHFGEEYAVFVVNPAWNDEFTRTILEINDKIDYSFTMTELK